MKELVLHIGTHKTGSTSIQKNLHQNAKKLESQGVFYPTEKTVWGGHHQLPWALGIKHPNRDINVTVDDCLDAWLNKKFEKIIISSEDFDFLPRDMILELKKKLRGLNVRIVIYLRDQVSYLISDYKQHVQMESVKFGGHLDDFYFKYKFERRFNYHALLMPWARIFGMTSIDVRSFSKDNLVLGDVVSDFFSKEGLGELEVESENISISDLQAYACSVMNAKRIAKEKQKKIIASDDWAEFERSVKNYSLLTDIKKEYVEQLYEDSNHKIFELFDLPSDAFFKKSPKIGLTRESQFFVESETRRFLENSMSL